MKVSEFIHHINRHRYKDHIEIQAVNPAEWGDPYMVRVHLIFNVPDSDTGKPTRIFHNRMVDMAYIQDGMTKEKATGWLWEQIQLAEIHEAGEWFTSPDGERPYFPHQDH